MTKRMTVRQWQTAYNEGSFAADDRDTMIAAGWYDWFCSDTQLKARMDRMATILTAIRDGGKINLDNSYPWFKNNCGDGLWDDLRISDLATGDNLLVISFPAMPGERRKSRANSIWAPVPTTIEVYTPQTSSGDPVFTGATDQVTTWLNTAW